MATIWRRYGDDGRVNDVPRARPPRPRAPARPRAPRPARPAACARPRAWCSRRRAALAARAPGRGTRRAGSTAAPMCARRAPSRRADVHDDPAIGQRRLEPDPLGTEVEGEGRAESRVDLRPLVLDRDLVPATENGGFTDVFAKSGFSRSFDVSRGPLLAGRSVEAIRCHSRTNEQGNP